MKKIFQTSLLSLLSLVVFSQTQQVNRCGTMELLNETLANDPIAKAAYLEYIEQLKLDAQKNVTSTARSTNDVAVTYVPVVFHIIHNGDAIGTGENIPDAVIYSQIDALNEDFALTNNNKNNIPAEFKSLAANVPIRFCLAQFDPSGNVTNGITRNNLGRADWDQNSIESTVKPSTIWDRKKYLNVWTVRMDATFSSGGGQTLAYSRFPGFGSTAQNDGVVARFNVIGVNPPQAISGANNGRTLSHEVGHWFALFHIWGDDNGLCSTDAQGGSDYVNDTPDQGDQYFGSPVYPKISCGSSDMFMNHMDYTDDAVRSMFSLGQSDRMVNALNTQRSGLLTAVSKCFRQLDASVVTILHPSDSICTDNFRPIVQVKNLGLTNITSGTFTINFDGNSQFFDWTGSIPSLTSLNISLPPITGVAVDNYHQLTVSFSDPNGVGADDLTTNDEATKSFYVYGSGGGVAAPFTEDFESGGFSSDWDVQNLNSNASWDISSSVGGYGNSGYCVFMDNAASNNRDIDELIMADYDLSSLSAPAFSFDVAYSKYRKNYDSLSVLYSLDCGNTWSQIWKDGGQTLSTSTAGDSVKPFVPDVTEWNTVKIPLWSLKSQPKVKFKFKSVSAGGNALYIDNINISQDPTGISSVSNPKFKVEVIPNPASAITAIKLPNQHPFEKLEVMNMLGSVVLTHNIIDPVSLIDVSSLSSGSYLVRLSSNKGLQTERLVIVK